MRVDRSRAPGRGGESVFNLMLNGDKFLRCNRIAVLLENKIKMRFPLRTLATSFIYLLFLTLVLSAKLKQESSQASPILGFSPSHAIAEHALESTFQSFTSPDNARDWHRTLTTEAHPAASDSTNMSAVLIA